MPRTLQPPRSTAELGQQDVSYPFALKFFNLAEMGRSVLRPHTQSQSGKHVKRNSGYTSRNTRPSSPAKFPRVAAAGVIFVRTIQARSRFQSSAEVGQPGCSFHSPFSAEYQ